MDSCCRRHYAEELIGKGLLFRRIECFDLWEHKGMSWPAGASVWSKNVVRLEKQCMRKPVQAYCSCTDLREEPDNCSALAYLISINLPPVPKPVIPEAVLIGNPASNRLKYGPPIKAFEGDSLHSGRIVLIRLANIQLLRSAFHPPLLDRLSCGTTLRIVGL